MSTEALNEEEQVFESIPMASQSIDEVLSKNSRFMSYWATPLFIVFLGFLFFLSWFAKIPVVIKRPALIEAVDGKGYVLRFELNAEQQQLVEYNEEVTFLSADHPQVDWGGVKFRWELNELAPVGTLQTDTGRQLPYDQGLAGEVIIKGKGKRLLTQFYEDIMKGLNF